VKIGSTLPEYARTAHGDLADQNRLRPVRGTRTLGPEAAKKLPMPARWTWRQRAAAWPATA
jgi:hypothetical protein